VVFTALAALPVAMHAQKAAPTTPEDVLKLAGDYLARYSTLVSGFECEETYVQREVSGGTLTGTRQVKSDFFVFGEGGHVDTFRDVFEVVGSPVRPHEHRLAGLFEKPNPLTLQQAQQLEDAGMQNFFRELQQIPKSMGVLEYVVKANQERSTFKIDSVKKMGDAQVAILKFVEQGMPRIVDSPDHTPASGRITVDLATGAIRQTEFLLTTKMADMRVVVVYALNPKLEAWLPASTDEHYNFTFNTAAANQATVMGSGSYNQSAAFEGRAAFANWHKTNGSSNFEVRSSKSDRR
jgi:hypothetical protein